MSDVLKVTFFGDYITTTFNLPKQSILDFQPEGTHINDIHLRGEHAEMFEEMAIQITCDFIKDHYGFDYGSMKWWDISVEEA